MKDYKVVFFGHRNFGEHRELEERLYPLIRELIQTKPYLLFYLGRNGEFDDIFTASIIKRAQKAFGNENNELTLVLPYNEKFMEHYAKYYDRIIIPECVEKVHPKGAITKRNRWMVEECDLFVGYVTHDSSGAYNALQYAKNSAKA